MKNALTITVLLLALGCGGDDGDGAGSSDAGPDIDAAAEAPDASGALACGETGAGTVDGTVAGETVAPVMFAWYDLVSEADALHALVIDEIDTTCGTAPDGANRIIFNLCAPIEAGVYDVVASADYPEGACPGDRVVKALWKEGFGDLAVATGGSLTIDEAEGCVTGEFTAIFPNDESASGSFAALFCPGM